jgi:hypothetical protein
MFWSMNKARQALTRMTSEIRMAGYIDESAVPPESPWHGVEDTPSNKCTFWTIDAGTGNPVQLSYEFRDATYATPACRNRVYLIKEATHDEYVLCDNVMAASFDRIYTLDSTCVKAVQISLTVQSGGSRRNLSSVAALRRFPGLVE